MSIESNKQHVRRFLGHFREASVANLTAEMSEDATWWILGRPDLFSAAGTHSRADMARIWTGLFARMTGGLEMEVVGIVAEGERVAAEVHSHSNLIDGGVYENQYHMLFGLQDEKIVEVREYADTLLIKKLFG